MKRLHIFHITTFAIMLLLLPLSGHSGSGYSDFSKGYRQFKLGNFEKAGQHLAQAWNDGYRNKNIAQIHAWVLLRLGHIKLTKKNFKQALHQYKAAHNLYKQYQFKWFKHYIPFLEFVQKRMAMGNITPQKTHRVLVVFIRRSNFTVTYPEKDSIITRLQQKHIDNAWMGLNITKLFWETGTKGKLSMSFKAIYWDGPLDKVDQHPTGFRKGFVKWLPNKKRLYEKLGKKLTDHLNDVDSVFFVWSCGKNNIATGGRESYPSPTGRSYVRRGWVQISDKRLEHNPVQLMIHEFFHVYEKLVGIYYVHGFLWGNRHHYRNWKGNTEFDYYLWHMSHYPNSGR